MKNEDNLGNERYDLDGSNDKEPENIDSKASRKVPVIPPWLPDWRTAEGYPDPKDTPRDQWAWEFLRRNPRYQRLYREGKRHKESWYKKYPNNERFSRYFKCVPKVTKGESYSKYIARCELESVIPKITPKRQKILDVFPVVEFSTKLDPANNTPPVFQKDYDYPMCFRASEDEDEIAFSIDGKDEVFIVFSAALPIKDQIEKARKYLLKQQQDYEEQGNELQHKGRVQTQPLRNYLRYLDGKASGATQAEIASYVHSNEDKNTAQQKVSKGLNQAESYRDIGYLKILGTEMLK